ncbi:MAG TPA: AAA domain-containing protein, partial [Chryseolinea sp.]
MRINPLDEIRTAMPDTSKTILSTYLRRLTNLSGNNRSLLLLKLHAEQLIDVNEFSFLNGEPSFEIINALIGGRNKKICQVLDSRMESNNNASRKLKKLQRIDKFIFEERGSNDLHVGWPFIRGKFSDGSAVRCPLMYFPVTIVQEGQHWVLQPRKDAGITLNKSFLLAFSFYNQVKLDEDLLDTSFEEFDVDSRVFRTQLYQLLRDKIEINFNPDNFQDSLIPFHEFNKQSFEDAHHNGELKLYPEAVLGIFPQAGSQLVPDYLKLIESETISDLEDFFVARNVLDTTDLQPKLLNHAISEEKIYTPFVLDAYQENAIKAIKNGHSIVVQGPPGTGKSQLICNLLADAIASGKKALLVCQKRAALDVVYARLKEIDLGDFLGLVHDFRNDRKDIYSKIASQIEGIENFKTLNRSVDVIQTERKFFQLCRRIDQIAEELEEFKFALFDDKECGLSVKELYLTSDLDGQTLNIKQEYQYFSFPEVPNFLRRMKVYSKYASWMEEPAYLWRDRKSFANLKVSDQKEIENTIREVPRYQQRISAEVEKLIGVGLNLEDCASLFLKEDDMLGMISVLKDDDTYRYFQGMVNEIDDETSLLWLANTERVILNCYNGHHPETTLPTNQLGKFQEVLQQCMDARGNIFRYIRWELFSKAKAFVRSVLDANELPYNKMGLNVLEQKIDNRLNLEHHLTSLKSKSWLIEIPTDHRRDSIKVWFEKQKLAARAKLVFGTFREINQAINVQKYSLKEFNTLIRDLLFVIRDVPEKKATWLNHITQ